MPLAQVIMSKSSANLIELFSSVQGEGILVGKRQVFLRFAGCNLQCAYCDTEREISATCNIEINPGSNNFQKTQNPVQFDLIMQRLTGWVEQWPYLHHSLSITGGEPLLHADLLVDWLPELRKLLPIYLETNGLLTNQLIKIIDNVDIISLDIKLPSTSKHTSLWQKHKSFLETAIKKQCYVKVVVGTETTINEIVKASRLIAGIEQNIPLIIQPVSNQLNNPQIGSHLLALQQSSSEFLLDVRIIPQTHVLIGVM
jgi:organic radical activating enzyme